MMSSFSALLLVIFTMSHLAVAMDSSVWCDDWITNCTSFGLNDILAHHKKLSDEFMNNNIININNKINKFIDVRNDMNYIENIIL